MNLKDKIVLNVSETVVIKSCIKVNKFQMTIKVLKSAFWIMGIKCVGFGNNSSLYKVSGRIRHRMSKIEIKGYWAIILNCTIKEEMFSCATFINKIGHLNAGDDYFYQQFNFVLNYSGIHELHCV